MSINQDKIKEYLENKSKIMDYMNNADYSKALSLMNLTEISKPTDYELKIFEKLNPNYIKDTYYNYKKN